MKRQAEPARSSGYLGSLDPVKIPGKEGGQLAFVLAVLNGKERKFVRKYLMWQLEIQPGFTSEDCQTVAWIIEHPEFFENAVTGMVEAMRQVADMWIDSGKSAEHPDSDDPTTRTVDVILPRRDYSLYDRMRVGLFWNLPRYLDMNRDGTRRITGSVPRIDLSSNAGLSSQLEDFGERFALYEFSLLLDSKDSRRIARCDKCRSYFAYERTRLRTVKRGVFCSEHKVVGGTKRKQESRKTRFDSAAQAWIQWEAKRRRLGQKRWIADEVNKRHGTSYGVRWVTQNLAEIQNRVEVLRGTESRRTG